MATAGTSTNGANCAGDLSRRIGRPVTTCIRAFAARMPTYITLKEVKKRILRMSMAFQLSRTDPAAALVKRFLLNYHGPK